MLITLIIYKNFTELFFLQTQTGMKFRFISNTYSFTIDSFFFYVCKFKVFVMEKITK